jgi:hypothetical protein
MLRGAKNVLKGALKKFRGAMSFYVNALAV